MQNWIFLAFLLGSVSEHVWVRVPRNLSLETRVDMRFISASLSSHFSVCHWPNFWAGGQKKLKKTLWMGLVKIPRYTIFHVFSLLQLTLYMVKRAVQWLKIPEKISKDFGIVFQFWVAYPLLWHDRDGRLDPHRGFYSFVKKLSKISSLYPPHV